MGGIMSSLLPSADPTWRDHLYNRAHCVGKIPIYGIGTMIQTGKTACKATACFITREKVAEWFPYCSNKHLSRDYKAIAGLAKNTWRSLQGFIFSSDRDLKSYGQVIKDVVYIVSGDYQGLPSRSSNKESQPE